MLKSRVLVIRRLLFETNPLLEPINSGGVAYSEVIVSTFAGYGRLGSNDGIEAIATFHFPTGIPVDANDNVYIADYYNTIIRKIDEFGMVITFAGTGSASSTDGLPTEASFNRLATISIDGNDNLFLTDESKHTIRKTNSRRNDIYACWNRNNRFD